MGFQIEPNATRIVVIGNGMVGHRFCEEIRALDPSGSFCVTVLGEEARPAYDRVKLTSYFTASSADELGLADEAWYRDRGIDLRLGVKATRIDRELGFVETSSGERIPYDHVVVATGSSPFVPRLPGVELEGVFVYRTIEDLDAIMARCARVSSCAVIGGGLLGLEAARAVQERGLRTHIVELAPRLMPRQIGPISSNERRRNASPNPGRVFSRSGSTASIVTSHAAMPVPPVRITVFTSPVSQLASTSPAIAAASSGTT